MAVNQTILVTGANGQVGKAFRALAPMYPQYNFLFAGREELAIENFDAVKKYFSNNTIHFCINCAAYTAVDKAETEKENAFLINANAAANLAAVCKEKNSQFIHISTDYVFDGTSTQPYKESDVTNPLGVYGQSKLKGEELVLQNNPAAIIIRTSWVYSSFGNNFVKTMLRLMKERATINVVNDQWGCPTYATDLVAAIMGIIERHSKFDIPVPPGHPGRHYSAIPNGNKVFNYCNEGIISWYNFAVAIKELTGSNCMVNPIPTLQYPTPAKRPQYSVLDTTKIKGAFDMVIPGWKESLVKCLRLMG
jgi:dTDP-4-dehydrorhamnose reductase